MRVKLIQKSLLSLPLSLLVIVPYLYLLSVSKYIPIFTETNFLITVISGLYILFSKRSYSLSLTFNIFTFVFFGFIPLLEAIHHTAYWGMNELTTDQKINANFFILIYMAIFSLFHFISSNSVSKSALQRSVFLDQKYWRIMRVRKSFQKLWIFFILILSSYLYLEYNGMSLLSVLIRSGEGARREFLSVIYFLFHSYYIHVLIPFSFVYYIYSCRNGVFDCSRVVTFLFLCYVVLFFSPASTERFAVAAVYLLLLFTLISHFRIKGLFSLTLLSGLFVALPVLEIFRNYSKNVVDFSLNFYLRGHFDAYQNFARLVDLEIVSFGRQLSGVLLFFVPRSFWPEKPVTSGIFFSDQAGLSWHNVSMPLIGEGYINFGLLGIVLFSAFLGYICGKFDRWYWAVSELSPYHRYSIHYLLMIGLFLAVLRGPLLSSFANLCGMMLAITTLVLPQYYISRLRLKPVNVVHKRSIRNNSV